MKRLFVLAVLTLCLLPTGASAYTAEFNNIQIITPWADPAEKGGSTVIHMAIMNNNKGRQRIAGFETNVSDDIVLKESGQIVDHVLINSNELIGAPNFTVELKRLRQPLEEGGFFLIDIKMANGRTFGFKVAIGEDTELD